MTQTPAADPFEFVAPEGYSAERDGLATFYFADGPSFPCHPLGTVWNGFDNVEISAETRAAILTRWLADYGEGEETADLRALPINAAGRVGLGFGYATQLDEIPLSYRAIVSVTDESGNVTAYTKPTLEHALALFFDDGMPPLYSGPDETDPLTREDAAASLTDRNSGRAVTLWDEDGRRFDIIAERRG